MSSAIARIPKQRSKVGRPYTCTHGQYSKTCTPEMRFWGKVDKSAGPEACWPWRGARRWDGYGRLQYNDKQTTANRVAYELAKGALAPGMHVLHACDNPPCCNPAHLSAGTHYENHIDKHLKNRDKRALPPETIREMRKAFAADTTKGSVARIAKQFGIGPGVACQIRLRKKYGWVE